MLLQTNGKFVLSADETQGNSERPDSAENVTDVDGFQEVTRRKNTKDKASKSDDINKSSSTSDNVDGGQSGNRRMKDKKAPGKHQPNVYDRQRPTKLPPRLAKQRENSRAASEGANNNNHNSTSCERNSTPYTAPSAAPTVAPPPLKNAWEKPLTAALRSNSPSQSVQPDNSSNSMSSLSKSIAPREGQDTGNIFSSNENNESIANTQRASPSCNHQVISKDDKNSLDGSSVPSKTIIFENTNFKAAAGLKSSSVSDFGSISNSSKYTLGNNSTYDGPKSQRQQRERRPQQTQNQQMTSLEQQQHNQQSHQQIVSSVTSHLSSASSGGISPVPAHNPDVDTKQDKPDPIELPITFPKGDESVTDMKLDFTFDPDIELRTDKVGVSKSSLNLVRSLAMTTSVHTPNSPSTEELNLKIASVKKMWDMDVLPSVTEHVEDTNVQQSFSSSNFSNVGGNNNHDNVNSGPQEHSPVIESYVGPKDGGLPPGSCDDSQDVYNTGMHHSTSTSGHVVNNMVYTSSAAVSFAAAKAEVSRSGNVCKVKPQQQAPNSSGVNPSAVASVNCASPGPPGVPTQLTGMGDSVAGGSVSPPLGSVSIGHSTANNIYPSLSGTAAFGGIGGAIPSPPIMYNAASQQVAQPWLVPAFC